MSSPSPLELLLFLNSLGDVVTLHPFFNQRKVLQDLSGFADQWQPYNRHKVGNPRWGLSLTSLDGGFSGTPDLYSLKDYNELHNTSYREDEFKTLTPAYKASPDLQHAVDQVGQLGRSHLLRLGKGGHFPPHRDNALIEPECFRIFACLDGQSNHYSVVVNDRQYIFDPGVLYLLNTTLTHSVVSFHDHVHFLVLNVPLNKDSVENLIGLLAQN